MKSSIPPFVLLSLFACMAGGVFAQHEFKAEGSSRQINMPDNRGTVNINQYLLKSDDYKALLKQRDDFDIAIEEKRADCAAFEAAGNAERLARCREGFAALHAQRDSTDRIITQFKEDVLTLAQTFERIPINSERLRIAKQLFEDGKFREVHAVMNTKEMTQEGDALLRKKERLQSGLQETDSLLRIKAEEFVVKAQAKAVDYADPRRIDSTAICYRQSLRYYDNAKTLYDFARFFSDNHQYDSTFTYFQKFITHPNADGWQIANAYFYLGDAYSITGNLPAALVAYTRCFETYKQLYYSNHESSFYKHGLAISYEKLGSTHSTLGDFPQALKFFGQST